MFNSRSSPRSFRRLPFGRSYKVRQSEKVKFSFIAPLSSYFTQNWFSAFLSEVSLLRV
jgi:hypothetical protein